MILHTSVGPSNSNQPGMCLTPFPYCKRLRFKPVTFGLLAEFANHYTNLTPYNTNMSKSTTAQQHNKESINSNNECLNSLTLWFFLLILTNRRCFPFLSYEQQLPNRRKQCCLFQSIFKAKKRILLALTSISITLNQIYIHTNWNFSLISRLIYS